jgi:hypothetical protein
MDSRPWWALKGFAAEPRSVFAKGDEVLYRVGGGPTNLCLGSFFSPLKVESVTAADSHLNISIWGNRCIYLATYRVKRGTKMWIGKVAHSERDIASPQSEQVFIESPQFAVELVKDIEPLKQDLVVSRAGHA